MPIISNHFITLSMMICTFIVSVNTKVIAQAETEPNFAQFFGVLEKHDDDTALQNGKAIFNSLAAKYRADKGFVALRSKMAAAEFLKNAMVTQLEKATNKQIFALAGDIFETTGKAANKTKNRFSVAPAKSYYDTSLALFSKPSAVPQLSEQEKQFLVRYYDLTLRSYTSSIAKAGQALAIAEPNFKGTYDYVLVLPLLHASETRAVNTDILPQWMQQSEQLDIFSDSCLLHYGFAWHAKTIAETSSRLSEKPFSPEQFYRTAAKKCSQLPNIAVDCLKRAVETLDPNKVDEKVNLRFEMVQVWMDSEDFSLGAGQAKSLADTIKDHKQWPKAIWLYYYALSRANNAQSILADIDTAIAEKRCDEYKSQMLYIKWWALRRQRNQVAQIAALEHHIIKEYPNDPMIAPILLSRATDLLAGQDYNGASELLGQLTEKFPSTKACGQAKKIMEKLTALKTPGQEQK